MLLNLPHRQFVFALPKALRIFFRHDRRLFGHVSRLIYHIIQEFYHQAAGRPIRTGVVIAHQTFGDMLRWNPHFHAIVLEGGFDDQGTFVYRLATCRPSPSCCVAGWSRCWWITSYSTAASRVTCSPGGTPASALTIQFASSIEVCSDLWLNTSHAPRSPRKRWKKIRYEPFKGRVLFHTTYSDYFKRWECQRQKSYTSSTLWTSLPSSEIACGNSTAHPTGVGATHSSLWFVLLAQQGSLDPHALRSTAGAIRLHEPR